MDAPTQEVYPDNRTYELVVFDVRIPGLSERFSRERGAWGECAEVEYLDLEHPVLVVRPGAALEVSR